MFIVKIILKIINLSSFHRRIVDNKGAVLRTRHVCSLKIINLSLFHRQTVDNKHAMLCARRVLIQDYLSEFVSPSDFC